MEEENKNDETKENDSKKIKPSEDAKSEENKVIKININYSTNPTFFYL